MKLKVKVILLELLLLYFSCPVSGAGVSFGNLMSAAKAAAQKGELEKALSQYNEALKAAENSGQMFQAVSARNQFLLSKRKYGQALQELNEIVDNKSNYPAARRDTLKLLARQVMWGEPDRAMQYIQRAQTIPAVNTHDSVDLGVIIGYIYLIKKEPDYALDVWQNLMYKKNVHPGLHYAVAEQIGFIYKKRGEFEDAYRYFQLAIKYGKKLEYINYSAAEKALKELKGKIKR